MNYAIKKGSKNYTCNQGNQGAKIIHAIKKEQIIMQIVHYLI